MFKRMKAIVVKFMLSSEQSKPTEHTRKTRMRMTMIMRTTKVMHVNADVPMTRAIAAASRWLDLDRGAG